jgi:hypothetical protein
MAKMKVFEYDSYEHYVECQTKANKDKILWTWVEPHDIEWVCNHKKSAEKILCHGTRNGYEQILFLRQFPDAEIIGTEISDTAEYFDMTVHHDFSKPKSEWINKFDIVYSNSFDHSYDPKKTILTWLDQLNETGKLYLEFCEYWAKESSASDPVEANWDEIEKFLNELCTVNTIHTVDNLKRFFVCCKK